MSNRGRFITFEGLDKAGKSTQIARLARRLQACRREVVLAREPGGTRLGEAIRALVMQFKDGKVADEAELLLFAASRAQLVRELIEPALAEGKIVLCDRFADSTVAYQGFARHLDLSVIGHLNELAIGGCRPDLTVFLDLSVEESFRRLRQVLAESHCPGDRFEAESRDFHEGVRNGFLHIARECPQRVVRFDATLPADEIEDRIWHEVSRRAMVAEEVVR